MPSSAGGFPWKADGDYTTVVYIKNETNVARKFVSHLVYEGGQYSLGIRDLKPGETIGIDFRELRDNQSPGSQEKVIPLDVDTGQIAWSVLGAENKVLSGRSEQISVTGGVASTYACANCCPNVIDGVQVNPLSLITEVSQVTQFTATQTERNCYDAQFGPYQANPNEWNSFSPSVATVDFTGNSEAVGVGDTNIEGCVERTIWYNWGGGYCEAFTSPMCNHSPVAVRSDVEFVRATMYSASADFNIGRVATLNALNSGQPEAICGDNASDFKVRVFFGLRNEATNLSDSRSSAQEHGEPPNTNDFIMRSWKFENVNTSSNPKKGEMVITLLRREGAPRLFNSISITVAGDYGTGTFSNSAFVKVICP